MCGANYSLSVSQTILSILGGDGYSYLIWRCVVGNAVFGIKHKHCYHDGLYHDFGIVVDDAIVTGENVFQRMQRGDKPLTASIRGTNEVAVPVIFGVITTMVSFYPLMMVSGFIGNFFSNIPMVVIPVLFFSLVESKLILPAHLKHCTHLTDKEEKLNIFSRFQKILFQWTRKIRLTDLSTGA